MTTFIERPEDYLGETVTVYNGLHRFEDERTITSCFDACGHVRDSDGEPCGDLVIADGPAALSSVYPAKNYTGMHRAVTS